ncbi:MAG: hypothetical protein GY870_12535 [archaeon]|nr:hypothetical protein [archaeon]
MSEKDTSFDEIEKILTEVCELTSDKCNNAITDYKKHGNRLNLLSDVFIAIDKCETPKCKTNKTDMYDKLRAFLRSKE